MKDERLSSVQIMTLMFGAILGVDILIVQQKIVSTAMQDAWISLLIAGLLAVASCLIFYYLATLYPDMDLPEITLHLGGKFLGRLFLSPILIYHILYTGLSARIFAQALLMFLLDRTPIYAIVLLMILVVLYAVNKGIYAIGGINDVMFPLCEVTIILLIFMSLQQADASYLKPVLFENTGNVLRGIFPGYTALTGFSIITYVYRYTQKSKDSLKWTVIGAGIPILEYIALTVVTIMVFSAQGVMSLLYPTLTLSKSIEFPGTFLERLESFIAILWIGIVFLSLVLFSFASVRNFSAFLGLKQKHYRYVVLGHFPLLLLIALLPESGVKVLDYFDKIKYLQVTISGILVPLLTVYAHFKKRKEAGG